MKTIETLDEALFWWINSHHTSFLDWILWVFSQHWSWAIVIVAVYGFVTLRKDRRGWLWVLIGIGLCFLLADQISSSVIKDGVQRLRPCHQFEGVRLFYTSKGGLYGFVSSHAANAFAIAMFLSLRYGGKKSDNNLKYKTPILPYLLMIWAAIVSYSRPYLGKHFPGDVVCGALLGLGVGAVVYFVIEKISLKIASRQSA